jgi:hypothetical protein
MSVSLPDVIKSAEEFKNDAPVFEASLDLHIKKIVICITKDLTADDEKLFTNYGKLVYYDDRLHSNLPIDTYPWDYLVFDVRESGDRYALMNSVLNKRDKYTVIVYSYAFEKDEIVPDADNHISSLPKAMARREDWEALLLQKRISKPRWYVSLFSCLLGIYNGVKK